MSRMTLIAGMGNIFLGDDGFGAEVARRLHEHRLPEDVRVADFGLRGFDLACALMDGYETVILVDATQRGGPPGTIYVIEHDGQEPDLDPVPEIDGHAMTPDAVFRLVKIMGGSLPKTIIVGCEPKWLGGDGGEMGLSDAVQAAVTTAVGCIEELLSTAKGTN